MRAARDCSPRTTNRQTSVATASTRRVSTAIRGFRSNFPGRRNRVRSRPPPQRNVPGACRMTGAGAAGADDDDTEPYPSLARLFDHHLPVLLQ